MRLNKYLAQNLQISRRNADDKIAAGHVKINNEKGQAPIINKSDTIKDSTGTVESMNSSVDEDNIETNSDKEDGLRVPTNVE